jgi:hypothetical protein
VTTSQRFLLAHNDTQPSLFLSLVVLIERRGLALLSWAELERKVENDDGRKGNESASDRLPTVALLERTACTCTLRHTYPERW